MAIKELSRNIHLLETNEKDFQIAMLSDIHWDNPKCDRKLLTNHLDYCLEKNIPVMINGDFFCLMQGKYDPRRSKKDILPEHNVANYLDAVIEDAVDWWGKYSDILTVIGYGNHETGIIRNCETDPLRRFADLLNYTNKSNVMVGGYGGWLIIHQNLKGTRVSSKIKYYHGSGGGGAVTKGAINLTRAAEMYEGMDVFTMGHIHENSCRTSCKETVDIGGKKSDIKLKDIHLMITGTYKEEYGDGYMGWHVERGAPPKPIGGRILTINSKYKWIEGGNGKKGAIKSIDSRRFTNL